MKKKSRAVTSRNGLVTIAVLVTFGVVALLLLAAAKLGLDQRRQLKRELQMQQTQLLADAAVTLAVRTHRDGDVPENGQWQEAWVEVTGYEKSNVKWRIDESDQLEVVATIGTPDRPQQKTTCSIQLRAEDWKAEKK